MILALIYFIIGLFNSCGGYKYAKIQVIVMGVLTGMFGSAMLLEWLFPSMPVWLIITLIVIIGAGIGILNRFVYILGVFNWIFGLGVILFHNLSYTRGNLYLWLGIPILIAVLVTLISLKKAKEPLILSTSIYGGLIAGMMPMYVVKMLRTNQFSFISFPIDITPIYLYVGLGLGLIFMTLGIIFQLNSGKKGQ